MVFIDKKHNYHGNSSIIFSGSEINTNYKVVDNLISLSSNNSKLNNDNYQKIFLNFPRILEESGEPNENFELNKLMEIEKKYAENFYKNDLVKIVYLLNELNGYEKNLDTILIQGESTTNQLNKFQSIKS